MPPEQPDVLRGTLDLLVLKTLALEPMHGWGIAQRIGERSRGVLEVNQGSLYLALQRLEQRGAIGAEWHTTDNNRRAKFYRLTAKGRRLLGDEIAFHIARETQKNVERGMAPDEARRRALVAFGGREQLKEAHHDRRGAQWLDDLLIDLRYSTRALHRNPALVAAAAPAIHLGAGRGRRGGPHVPRR